MIFSAIEFYLAYIWQKYLMLKKKEERSKLWILGFISSFIILWASSLMILTFPLRFFVDITSEIGGVLVLVFAPIQYLLYRKLVNKWRNEPVKAKKAKKEAKEEKAVN